MRICRVEDFQVATLGRSSVEAPELAGKKISHRYFDVSPVVLAVSCARRRRTAGLTTNVPGGKYKRGGRGSFSSTPLSLLPPHTSYTSQTQAVFSTLSSCYLAIVFSRPVRSILTLLVALISYTTQT